MDALHNLVREAFVEEKGQTKTAAPKQQVKLASGATSTQFLDKVALALENVASGFEKGAQFDAPLGASEFSPDQWVTDEVTPLDLGTGENAYSFPAQSGEVPEGDPVNPNLGGWVPENNYGTPPGFETPGGVDYEGAAGGMVTEAALRQTAKQRAKLAQERVLGKVKAAFLRKRGQDASIPPAETITDPLGGDKGGMGSEGVGAQGSMSEIDQPKADVPQSTEGVVSATNTELDDARKKQLAAVLGPAAVAAADADKTQEQVLEHASGDEVPTDKQAALSEILNNAVLTRIAQGG